MKRLLVLFAFGVVSIGFAQVPRNYHLEDVDWSISFDEKAMSIRGDVTNMLTPLEDGITQIPLNEGRLDIGEVTVNDKKAKFKVDPAHEQMIVNLPAPAHKGDQLKVRILYTGKPEAGVYFVSPDRSTRHVTTEMVYTQGEAEDTRYWLPTYDEPEDKATSECHITVPQGYYALSNGQLMDVQHVGDHDVFHWKIGQPHSTYLISFVAGRYVEGKESWDGIPVSYFVPEGTEGMGEPTFGGTADMVHFYSELTGVRYPYAKFAQSAVGDFPFGGMENISAVTQTIDALHPASESEARDERGLVLHELAHQWFGDLATCRDWSNNWLNEGFATFLPHFYFRDKDGEDEFQIQKVGDIDAAIGAMSAKRRPMVETKYNVPMDLFDGHAYPGGSARMFTLMAMLGEKAFWQGVHEYLTEYAFKPATTDEFFEVMSKSTGRDLSAFDRQYFHTAALPTVAVSRNDATITLKQGNPPFELDLDVWEWEGGAWKKQTVALHGAEATLTLDNANDPYLVDPLVNWLATVNYAEKMDANEIGLLYANAPNAAQKARLLRMASDNGDKELIASLFESETSKAMRRSLADYLGSCGPEEVLKAAQDADPHIRLVAIEDLGGLPASDSVTARLKQIWTTASSVAEKGAALRALLRVSKDAGLADSAWKMDAYNDAFRTAALDWWTDNDREKARATALAVLKGAYSEVVREAAISALGKVKDKPGEKLALKALEDRLGDKSLHEKMTAIYALQSYGDKTCLPLIHKFDDYSMYQLRDEAKSVEAALEAGK